MSDENGYEDEEKCIHQVGFHYLRGPFDGKEKRCPFCWVREDEKDEQTRPHDRR